MVSGCVSLLLTSLGPLGADVRKGMAGWLRPTTVVLCLCSWNRAPYVLSWEGPV